MADEPKPAKGGATEAEKEVDQSEAQPTKKRKSGARKKGGAAKKSGGGGGTYLAMISEAIKLKRKSERRAPALSGFHMPDTTCESRDWISGKVQARDSNAYAFKFTKQIRARGRQPRDRTFSMRVSIAFQVVPCHDSADRPMLMIMHKNTRTNREAGECINGNSKYRWESQPGRTRGQMDEQLYAVVAAFFFLVAAPFFPAACPHATKPMIACNCKTNCAIWQ